MTQKKSTGSKSSSSKSSKSSTPAEPAGESKGSKVKTDAQGRPETHDDYGAEHDDTGEHGDAG